MLVYVMCIATIARHARDRVVEPASALDRARSHQDCTEHYECCCTGLGDRPGLVVFNFDECGAPRVNPATGTTYFQDGLSRLVSLRWIEAQKRFEASNRARDILPVVVIAGSHSAHMNLLRTGSGRARLFTLGRPLLDDESLLETAMDFLLRVAAGSGRELPETAGAASAPLVCYLWSDIVADIATWLVLLTISM